MIQEPETHENYPVLDDFTPSDDRDALSRKPLSSPSFNQSQEQGGSGSGGPPVFKFDVRDKENSNSGVDFTKKLMDKVKKQAETILQLENYKLMAEKKMNELNATSNQESST